MALNTKPTISMAVASNTFSLSLFKQLTEKNDSSNVFYSPLSISSALALLQLGARGNTATQMSKVLHFKDGVHTDAAMLMSVLNSDRNKSYDLSLANRLYGEQSYRFSDEFLSTTGKQYDAELEPVDFIGNAEGARLNVNSWVEKQTQGKIKDLLAPGVLDEDTKLVLANAIYFKAKWDKPFREDLTRDEQFRLSKTKSKPVKMMHQTSRFPLSFIPEVDCLVVELPYTGKDLSMLIFLPDNTSGLKTLEKKLTYARFVDWTNPNMMDTHLVVLGLPRFKMEETYDMKDILIEMGMVDAFNAAKSDFSGMSPANDLVLSKVVHKAFVEVNEKGTEAAASTVASTLMPLSAGPPLSHFIADHPFLFFIRHNPTMSILFAGRYCSPP